MDNMKKYAFYMPKSLIDDVDNTINSLGKMSRAEFIREAVDFYIGYLNSLRASDYLSPMLSRAIKSEIESVEKNISEMIFKLAVQSAVANIFIASSKGMSVVGVEELETSIHPRLLKGLLEILDEVLDDTSLIISSHSPFLVQYIKTEKIYVGIPNTDGIAEFKKTKTSKTKALIKTARDHGMAVGEYLFELMAGDQDSIDTLSFYLED